MATEVQTTPRRRTRIFYGWWIVLAGAGVGLLISLLNAHGALDLPIRETRSIPVIQLLLVASPAILFIPFLVLRPIVGLLADSFGPRPLIVPALLVSGLAFLGVSNLKEEWQAYLILTLVVECLAFLAPIVMATAVVNWFVRSRGKALALLLSGATIASALQLVVLILLLEVAIRAEVTATDSGASTGWYPTTSLIAGTALLALAIPIFLVLRKSPGMSATTAGSNGPTGNDANSQAQRDLSNDVGQQFPQSRRAIIFSRPYMLFVGAVTLQPLAVNAIYFSLGTAVLDSLFFFSFRWFGLVGLVSALVSLAFLFLFGALSDMFDKRLVVAGTFALQLLCAILVIFTTNELVTVLLQVAVAVGIGTNSAVSLALLADYWGRRHFGFLMGAAMSVAAFVYFFWATALPLMIYGDSGEVDVTHPKIAVTAILPLAIALILILLMKRPQSAVPNPPVAETEPQVA